MATFNIKTGYPALADMMAHSGLYMFKRFASLNARNLLYMQAELLLLERELNAIAEYDHLQNPDLDAKNYATSCEKLMESLDNGNAMQWNKILEVRTKLEEYSEL